MTTGHRVLNLCLLHKHGFGHECCVDKGGGRTPLSVPATTRRPLWRGPRVRPQQRTEEALADAVLANDDAQRDTPQSVLLGLRPRTGGGGDGGRGGGGGVNGSGLHCPHSALAAPASRLSSPSVQRANVWHFHSTRCDGRSSPRSRFHYPYCRGVLKRGKKKKENRSYTQFSQIDRV